MDIVLIKTFLEIKGCRHFGKVSDNPYLTQVSINNIITMK
jgi:hypothetical protein